MNMPNWKKAAMGTGAASIILASLAGYYEGTSYTPYRDVTGIWTNCQGNTHGVDPARVMTSFECQGVDAANQDVAFQSLHKLVSVPLTRNQSIAFADFIYNVGADKFSSSTMRTYINAGEVANGCKQLLRWVYAGGKKLSGLVARRQAEYTICTTENPQ